MSKLSTEILQQIFRELIKKDSQDGLSILMVNRQWCKIIVPMMWENPFMIANCLNHYKVIRTLLSTLDVESRSSLIDNGIDLSSSPSGAIFDYSYFIRNISYDYIYKGIKNYIFSEYEDEGFDIKATSDVDYEKSRQIRDVKIRKIRLMFRQLCALMLNRSEFIKTIRRFHNSSHITKDLDVIEDEINMIPFLPGANKSLQELYGIHISGCLDFAKFQMGLSHICKNITLIKINCESMDASHALASLIETQKKLVILIVEFSKDNLFVPILESLENHRESLEYLSLRTCDFNIISDKALEVLMSCNKLEILSLYYCVGLDNEKFLSLSTAFPLLRKFTFNYKNYYSLEKFLIGIIKTSNQNLRTFTLDSFTPKIIEAILKYSTEFTSCVLGRDRFLSSEELNKKYVEFVTILRDYNNEKFGYYKNMNLQESEKSIYLF